MRLNKYLMVNELARKGNIGFEEMMRFYNQATPTQLRQMEEIAKRGDWDGFRRLIKQILGVDLQ